MALVYLNEDRSVLCNIDNNGQFTITSNHANTKNAAKLIQNITNITSVEVHKDRKIIKLKGVPFVSVTNDGIVTSMNLLTSFETRLFAQGENIESLPFDRESKTKVVLKTDLHTHFAGALSPVKLINCGIGNDVVFPTWILDKAKVDYSGLRPVGDDGYALEDLLTRPENVKALINAMKIDTSEQETFNKMEEIYAARGPFTKNPKMFIPIIREIARDCQKHGVKYIELSLSSIISSKVELQALEDHMPEIEKETGVKVRFLGALWRHSDKEWNADEVDQLKVTSQSPYIVGCDVMGHETNSTMEFYDNIKELAKHAMMYDPNFVIRVHAGENPLFKANARQVLLAVEEAHYELCQDFGKDFPYPQVRIGHGIYGFDEPAPWDENERTKHLSMRDLCREIDPIIEFNMSSNLSLNNINGLDEIPIKKYIEDGIRVVLGTDGRGIYSTGLDQEVILAQEAGLTIKDLRKIKQTEEDVIKRAYDRFSTHKRYSLDRIKEHLDNCFSGGSRKFTKEVSDRKNEEYERLKKELSEKIKECGAITDLDEVNKDIEGKTPVMITGSSKKHWPQISEKNRLNIKIALDVLVRSIDTKKAYLVTGGTNHGVEREAHILADRYIKESKSDLIVLGTLTEEAMNTETNSIERNTITHAMIPVLNKKPAKRWFDLPDTVLNMIESNNGAVVAIGGGAIVSDIIQRAHNMGLNLSIMSGVEGASGDKSKSLDGNDYSFADAKELIIRLMENMDGVIKEDITPEKIDQMVQEAHNRLTNPNYGIESVKSNAKKESSMQEKKKIVKLTSANPEEYPDMDIECFVVEDMKAFTSFYVEQLQAGGEYPRMAKKTAQISARPGQVGEEVITRVGVERNGKMYYLSETKGVVEKPGSMIVKNPDGEEYIVKPEVFAEKYKQTEQPGVYEPIAEPMKYVTLKHDIVFKTANGREMVAAKGAVLNISNLEMVYAIQNEAFKKTYTPGKEVKLMENS